VILIYVKCDDKSFVGVLVHDILEVATSRAWQVRVEEQRSHRQWNGGTSRGGDSSSRA
jgi:hypothetical protein